MELPNSHSGKATRRWPGRLAKVALVIAVVVWLLFFANWPAHKVASAQLISPGGGAPVVLTLMVAQPVVQLPFTGDTAWVQCGDLRWKLHGRDFGSGVGRVAVSPDGTQAIVHKSFEGSEFPAILIDLKTTHMQRVNRWVNYESLGWTMQNRQPLAAQPKRANPDP